MQADPCPRQVVCVTLVGDTVLLVTVLRNGSVSTGDADGCQGHPRTHLLVEPLQEK